MGKDEIINYYKQQIDRLMLDKQGLELKVKIIDTEIQVLKEILSHIESVDLPMYPYPWMPIFPDLDVPRQPYNPWIENTKSILSDKTELSEPTYTNNTILKNGDKK